MKLGFTVGCWDLFHRGHQVFLQGAKETCDYLYVATMTDFWCRVQKGANRPAQPLAARIERLRNTGLADKIVVLDTLDIDPYLQMVDLWIQGEGQRNLRTSSKTPTIVLPRTPGISTTELIAAHHR